MKKLLFIISLLVGFGIHPAMALADDDVEAAGKRMTTAERKETIKNLVEKKENGDVVIGKNPAANNSLKAKAPRVPGYLMDLMLHIDPNLDFEKFQKIMVKYAGESGTRYAGEVLKGCDEYLATNNMRLKPVKFQPNNIRNRIDNGLPYFLILRSDDAYAKIGARSKRRPSTNDWKEWNKTLRKEEIKKREGPKYGITWALLRGYNKESGEYFVQVNGRDIWMTDSELKMVLSSMHEPRI